MKKFILAAVVATMAVLNVQSATHAKVQLWEGGPYWATTNIGADNPWDYGLYFWCGDTIGHRPSVDGKFSFNFSNGNSAIYTSGRSVSELQSAEWVTSDGVLTPAHDAAHVHWGGVWRMPTMQELSDLCSKCDWAWTTLNGVKGYVVCGRGGYASNSIFLPCAGYGGGAWLRNAGSVGYYWSSVPYSGSSGAAHELFFSDYQYLISYGGRYDGQSIRPVQDFGEGAPADFVVHFNANGGTGTMAEQTFEDGKEQKLSKNTYRKDGYVFQGWAVAANGEVVYKDEASITIDSDMTLYAAWANPPLTLTAESADWSSGSITLRCEDADTSGAEHEYYLSYYEAVENEKKWYDIDGATRVKASLEVDSNGNSVLVARLTDERFSKRNMGWSTVKYRVNDETGRMAECETRHRHGLFVAVSEYADPTVKDLSTPARESAVLRAAYERYGGSEFGGFRVPLENSPTRFMVLGMLDALSEKVAPGDVFLFSFMGHGGTRYLCCNDYSSSDGETGRITAEDLANHFKKFCDGAGMVAIIYCCHSASMFVQDNDSMNLGRVGWILSSQADEQTWSYSVTSIICNDGWFNGKADVLNGEYGFGDGDGYVTFAELAEYGLDWTIKNEYYGHRQQMKPANTFILSNIVAGKIPSSNTSDRKWKWLTRFASLFSSANGDVVAAETMPAANGCRTVGECYALGIDPEDPDDDFKVTHFEMKDGKPVITLNHTEDGSGNSFLPRVKTLGKADLSDAEWREVPEDGDDTMRFFKVEVEMP